MIIKKTMTLQKKYLKEIYISKLNHFRISDSYREIGNRKSKHKEKIDDYTKADRSKSS